MSVTLLWILCVLLIVVGALGTVLPVLPGTALIFLGILLGAWIDDFARVGPLVLTLIGVLTVLAWVLDYLAGLMGAKKAGASKLALVGAMLGTIGGLMMGMVGVLFMPLVGAAVGEYIARRDEKHALKVGAATWLGILIGLLAKVVLACMMIGIFVAALIF